MCRENAFQLRLAQLSEREVRRRVRGALARCAVRDERAQFLDEGIGENLYCRALVNICAVGEAESQFAGRDASVDLDQVPPQGAGASLQPERLDMPFAAVLARELSLIIEADLGLRQSADSSGGFALSVEVTQHTVSEPVIGNASQLLFNGAQSAARVARRQRRRQQYREDGREPANGSGCIEVAECSLTPVTLQIAQ